MTTHQIALVLQVTDQQARNIARDRGWKILRVGKRGNGVGTLYRRGDVIAEARRRAKMLREHAEQNAAQADAIDAWARSVGAE